MPSSYLKLKIFCGLKLPISQHTHKLAFKREQGPQAHSPKPNPSRTRPTYHIKLLYMRQGCTQQTIQQIFLQQESHPLCWVVSDGTYNPITTTPEQQQHQPRVSQNKIKIKAKFNLSKIDYRPIMRSLRENRTRAGVALLYISQQLPHSHSTYSHPSMYGHQAQFYSLPLSLSVHFFLDSDSHFTCCCLCNVLGSAACNCARCAKDSLGWDDYLIGWGRSWAWVWGGLGCSSKFI